MDDHSTHHWSQGLPSVIYAINNRTTHTTKKTPYQLVFGQEPKTDMVYWKGLYDAAVKNDVSMDDLIIDKIDRTDDPQIASETIVESKKSSYPSGNNQFIYSNKNTIFIIRY